MSGCSMLPSVDPVEVVRVEKRPPMYHPPLPQELQLLDIDWEVINPELMRQYLTDLENGEAPQNAYYALTGKDYENLSMNMAEFTRYIKDILAIVEYYRKFEEELEATEKD